MYNRQELREYILFLLTHFFSSAQAVVKKLEVWNAFIVSSKALMYQIKSIQENCQIKRLNEWCKIHSFLLPCFGEIPGWSENQVSTPVSVDLRVFRIIAI